MELTCRILAYADFQFIGVCDFPQTCSFHLVFLKFLKSNEFLTTYNRNDFFNINLSFFNNALIER
jgi:hypothetical protein